MRERLLILHGAAGSKTDFEKLATKLDKHFDVLAMNFSGHGGEPFLKDPFSIALFAQDAINFLNKHEIRRVTIFGYSMGGFVAIYLASRYPERVSGIFTLATKFNWNKETVKQQIKLLDPKIIAQKIPAYAKELQAIHLPNDWQEVLTRTIDMMQEMGRKNPLNENDLAKLEIPVVIGMGDRDNLVIIEESVFSYRLLKKGQLMIMPDTPHSMGKVDNDILAGYVLRFMFKIHG